MPAPLRTGAILSLTAASNMVITCPGAPNDGGDGIKSVGILTQDFALAHDLIRMLREAHLPVVSLAFDDKVPSHVGVVITTPAERSRTKYAHVVVATPGDPLIAVVGAAQRVLAGEGPYDRLVIGIDPGARPGIALLGDGKLLRALQVPRPEDVVAEVHLAAVSYPAKAVLVRIGDGDPTPRNRILNALEDLRAVDPASTAPAPVFTIEISDERRTTGPGSARDKEAARRIGLTPGHRFSGHVVVAPTAGEVREVQRQSRIRSTGRLTISQRLATRVARGELSLDEAISAQIAPRPIPRRRRPGGPIPQESPGD